MEGAFGNQAVLAKEVAVVRAEDDMFFVQQRYVMKRKR